MILPLLAKSAFKSRSLPKAPQKQAVSGVFYRYFWGTVLCVRSLSAAGKDGGYFLYID